MKNSANEKSDCEPQIPYYHFFENEHFWFASGSASRATGMLCFDKRTQSYEASFFDDKIIFPKLASGNYASKADCPVDSKYKPKAEFLMLLALREGFPTESPGRRWDPLRWRKMAIEAQIAEREKDRGLLPEKNRASAMEIAESWSKFESHVAGWLANAAQEPGAGRVFRRYAGWLDALEKLEKEGIPINYQKFYRAVEIAAREANAVPTQKAVKAAFEAGMSANQIGSGEGFRELMRRLKFNWLPRAGRGPDSKPRKSGI
jgi:hypothetical protein